MLEIHASRGEAYEGIGGYFGYNELIVSSAPWVEQLPQSVEAIFIVDCAEEFRSITIGGNQAGSFEFATSCAEAQQRGRDMHAAYLRAYDLSAEDFPLLMLRPDDFDHPFVEVPSGELAEPPRG